MATGIAGRVAGAIAAGMAKRRPKRHPRRCRRRRRCRPSHALSLPRSWWRSGHGRRPIRGSNPRYVTTMAGLHGPRMYRLRDSNPRQVTTMVGLYGPRMYRLWGSNLRQVTTTAGLYGPGTGLRRAPPVNLPFRSRRNRPPTPAGRSTAPRMSDRYPGRMQHATLTSGPRLSRLRLERPHPGRPHPGPPPSRRPRPETSHPFGRRSGRRTDAAPDLDPTLNPDPDPNPDPNTTPSSVRPAHLHSTGCSAGLPAAGSRSI